MPRSPSPAHRILTAVQAAPGPSLAELARALQLPHSVVRYHVARLEAQGRVATCRVGKRRLVVPTGLAPGPLALAGAPGSRRILVRLAELAGPAALHEVAAGMPMGRTGVHWHLQRLVRLGLVTRCGARGRVRYAPTRRAGAPASASA